MTTVDLLAFGAHPDDVELGCGGILLSLAQAGRSFAICDLTRGEAATFGTPEERAAEGQRAARALGATERVILDLGDARLEPTVANRLAVARVIRIFRPRLILAPLPEDLHPDHAAAGVIVRDALFAAALAKAPVEGAPHRVPTILFVPAYRPIPPTFVVDVTPFYERKMAAVREHRSQFGEREIPEGFAGVGFTDKLFHVESQMRHFGSLINVPYGEALVADRPLSLADPLMFAQRP
jgi:bacillithiol biosynthesis deacetylase BshB1